MKRRAPVIAQPTDADIDSAEQRVGGANFDEHLDRPAIEELHQADAEDYDSEPIVKVKVCEPARVEELPTTLGGAKTIALAANGDPVRILNADPRRKLATIHAPNGDVWLARTDGECRSASSGASSPAFLLGANALLTYTGADELYARPETGQPAFTVSVLVEQWAR